MIGEKGPKWQAMICCVGRKQKISTKKTSHVEACSHGTLLGLASTAPTAAVAGLPPGTGGAPLLQGNLLSWGGIL